jgi:hypothetical protein
VAPAHAHTAAQVQDGKTLQAHVGTVARGGTEARARVGTGTQHHVGKAAGMRATPRTKAAGKTHETLE